MEGHVSLKIVLNLLLKNGHRPMLIIQETIKQLFIYFFKKWIHSTIFEQWLQCLLVLENVWRGILIGRR